MELVWIQYKSILITFLFNSCNLYIYFLMLLCIIFRLYYKPGTSIEGIPQLVPGDGDGTVNLRSLEGCKYWQGKQKQKVYSQTFPGVDHMEILRNINVLTYIRTILQI